MSFKDQMIPAVSLTTLQVHKEGEEEERLLNIIDRDPVVCSSILKGQHCLYIVHIIFFNFKKAATISPLNSCTEALTNCSRRRKKKFAKSIFKVLGASHQPKRSTLIVFQDLEVHFSHSCSIDAIKLPPTCSGNDLTCHQGASRKMKNSC